MAKVNHPFQGAPTKKPTLKHRPAIWECMLGTVYAMNDQFKVKYFDYNWDAARAYAGVDEADRDPRVFKNKRRVSWTGTGEDPRFNKLVLWVREKSV